MNKAKYIMMSAAALLLSGCAADGALTPQDSSGAISFSAAAVEEGATRGFQLDLGYLTSQGFKVYANSVKPGTSTAKVLMEGTQMTHADQSWTYSPIVYWPTDDSTVDFFAVVEDDDNRNVSVTYAYDKMPHVIYRVPDNVTEQTEYLWAAPILNSKDSQSPVHFKFQHALACVEFYVKYQATSDPGDLKEALTAAADQAGSSDVLDSFKTLTAKPNDFSTSYGAKAITGTVAATDDTKYVENLKLTSFKLEGIFPKEGMIDPRETDINKIWQFEYGPPAKTIAYTLIGEQITKPTSGQYSSKEKMFLLPCKTNCTIYLTYQFEYGDGKYEFILSKEIRNQAFEAGKVTKFNITPDFSRAWETLEKIVN